MGAIKPEFPPLFPFGFHVQTEAQLHALLVTNFPLSKRRPWLWENFRTLLAAIKAQNLSGRIWLDGSFLTEKIDPDDIDLIFEIQVDTLTSANGAQRALIDAINSNAFHDDPNKLHTFVMPTAPMGHVFGPQAAILRERWIKDWGYSLIKKEPKGIAILEVVP